jgi:predicted nucleic acid-binding Zn ribbon protein
VTQRITEPPIKRCRICRSKARRLISATGFILKGGGWYADGYSSSRRNGESTSSGTHSDAGKGASSGGEGKAGSAKDT